MKGTKQEELEYKKAEDEEMEDEDTEAEDEEMEDEEKGMKYKKSETGDDEITEDDLEKSIKALEDYAQAEPTSRKDQLLRKAQETDLEKSEKDELFQLLGGEPESVKETVGDQLVKSFEENETISKALDVSDYLDAQHGELCKSLKSMGDALEASDSRQQEFNLILAKAVSRLGKLVKSLADDIDTDAQKPARAPKSAGVPGGSRVLEKSFAGQSGQSNRLSKADVLNTMTDMIQKGHTVRSGEDLLIAASKYEQTNQISSGLYSDILSYRQAG